MEEEYRAISNFHRYINIVESRVLCTPPKIQCIDDSGIHKFDTEMENVSIGLAQDLMVDSQGQENKRWIHNIYR